MDEFRELQTLIQEIQTLISSKVFFSAKICSLIVPARERLLASGDAAHDPTIQVKKHLNVLSQRIIALGEVLNNSSTVSSM
jgi:hypothetical protein